MGVTLPRRSVDQALSGYEVPSDTSQLLPGDILAFSRQERGREVTHVGLYVGEGRFIHSSAAGVRVSLLFPEDAEGGWWWRRWIGTRRLANAER